jgi:hypothetical protein
MLMGGPRSGKSPDMADHDGDARLSYECVAANSFSRACMAAIRLAVRCFRKAGVEARSGAGTPGDGAHGREAWVSILKQSVCGGFSARMTREQNTIELTTKRHVFFEKC